MTDAESIAAAALDRWLDTDDHLNGCIGYSEGCSCCLDAGDGTGYGERQATVLAVVFGALRDAGFRLLGPDGADALRTTNVTISDPLTVSEAGEARIRATRPDGG